MREITPTTTNHLPTPPPTQKKPSISRLPPASPASPSLEAMLDIADGHGNAAGWRNLPLVLYESSRQLQADASKPKSSGKKIIDLEEEEKEPLFWAKSVSPANDESVMEIEGEVDDEDDEIVFVGSAMTIIHSSTQPPSENTRPVIPLRKFGHPSHSTQQDLSLPSPSLGKRLRFEMEEEEEPEFMGHLYKNPQTEVAEGSKVSSREDTPLRTMSNHGDSCSKCGCTCNSVDRSRLSKGKGTGSNTLLAKVRGNITALLLNQDQSLYDQLRTDSRVRDWKDIAVLVGARREDFDRVRHSARWLQMNLPGLIARGMV
ncbi:hypothetical protein I302_101819 [Kwoniella bestiolae CBS 10118]|uniref:Uncharacterized protein n=1 Tax=Kwoniella bestiolae CBS 10118 TaxID=1296100 RepID=A0A1B9GDA9_9TREE|nr:hypothetical protein I302_00499 [Kwoniella bestiolae CBS 10118]OCF29008.1 hypothetical protein I302_00499 [Kwoniella bestiolae CBS 10118]